METATIEQLAYDMKEAKANNRSPIFFLGAGASKTGGIPLANEIVADILVKHAANPRIKNLKSEDKTYAKLMDCLGPNGRNTLLKDYINDSKINVTHIYLAQLMTQGYVDYVLTVNFDNLMLKALALFNEFPSTYDMAILNDLTTSTFKEKSVVYLHGQHHGLWLLNTEQEMAKVNDLVPKILHSIKDGRPWVFVGYSGNDPVFEHIKGLGRFDNGLYWVAFNDEKPAEAVRQGLLEQSHSNAFVIEGYDADLFMLKLNSALGLPEPTIIDKPFTSIRAMLGNIVDIDDKEHFKGVKQRLEIAKGQVNEAILQFEQGKVEAADKTQAKAESDLLQKEIIDLIIKEDYQPDKIDRIAVKAVALNNAEINTLLAGLYYNWGSSLDHLAKTQSGDEAEALYQQAFDKYHKAIEINPDYHDAFNIWGNGLGRLADTKSGDEAEALYQQAFDKYHKAIEIKPDDYKSFNNWGTNIGHLSDTKSSAEAEALYQHAFDKYRKAIEIKPDYHLAFYGWGTYLGHLAKIQSGAQAEASYQQAFDKYHKAIEIKPDYHEVYFNWGTDLGDLAKTQSGDQAEALYRLAFDKFQKAVELKPDYHQAYYNWGTNLLNLAKTQASGGVAEALYRQALEKYQKAALGGGCYNLACTYALMQDKDNALLYLNRSLENKQIETEFVTDDTDWAGFLDDEDFKAVINRYAKL
ncbi:MAG: SIR2 family protein [Methylobacter sp.]|nr:SIR2 family protein [Methylobacter sp.]